MWPLILKYYRKLTLPTRMVCITAKQSGFIIELVYTGRVYSGLKTRFKGTLLYVFSFTFTWLFVFQFDGWKQQFNTLFLPWSRWINELVSMLAVASLTFSEYN